MTVLSKQSLGTRVFCCREGQGPEAPHKQGKDAASDAGQVSDRRARRPAVIAARIGMLLGATALTGLVATAYSPAFAQVVINHDGTKGDDGASAFGNANGDPARFAAYRLPVVPDTLTGFAGPLAGILAGMDRLAAERPGEDSLVSVAADTPFVPDDLVERLHAARAAAGTPIACAASGGRRHHAIGLWPVALREDLRAALSAGERRLGQWAGRHGVAVAEWPAEPLDPFFNINTPADLAEAERLIRSPR